MDEAARTVFVIMPFKKTAARGQEELDRFFEYHLKRPIESCTDLRHRYNVRRSESTFDITAQIVQDLYDADVVLCDLSGEHGNPNVMYELGVRLALTHKPVIMFREVHASNKPIFDVSHYHTEPYDPSRPESIERFVLKRLKEYDHEEEVFRSPVLTIIGKNPTVIAELERRRALSLLRGLLVSLQSLLRASGGSLTVFLESVNAEVSCPDGIRDLPEFVLNNKDMLGTLDWSLYRFQPNVPPALHATLSDFTLSLTIDEWIAELWLSILSEYYGYFFSSDLFWSNANHHSIVPFILETHHLALAVDELIGLILARNEKESSSAMLSMLRPLCVMAILSEGTREDVERRIAALEGDERMVREGG